MPKGPKVVQKRPQNDTKILSGSVLERTFEGLWWKSVHIEQTPRLPHKTHLQIVSIGSSSEPGALASDPKEASGSQKYNKIKNIYNRKCMILQTYSIQHLQSPSSAMLTTFKNRPVTSRMKMNASNLKHHIFNVSQLPAPRWGAGGRGEA